MKLLPGIIGVVATAGRSAAVNTNNCLISGLDNSDAVLNQEYIYIEPGQYQDELSLGYSIIDPGDGTWRILRLGDVGFGQEVRFVASVPAQHPWQVPSWTTVNSDSTVPPVVTEIT